MTLLDARATRRLATSDAIFHSDHSLHGGEVRFKQNGRPSGYEQDKIILLVNRALAYFTTLTLLRLRHIRSYTEPKEIAVHPENASHPNERAVVMVREVRSDRPQKRLDCRRNKSWPNSLAYRPLFR
jgi:hypothetical protein